MWNVAKLLAWSDLITCNLKPRRMVLEPNVHMYGQDCEPVLRHPWMIRIPFATNRNLSVFCANTKRTGCAACPFHTPGVLCSPQVCGKLINCARANYAAHKRRARVYKALWRNDGFFHSFCYLSKNNAFGKNFMWTKFILHKIFFQMNILSSRKTSCMFFNLHSKMTFLDF